MPGTPVVFLPSEAAFVTSSSQPAEHIASLYPVPGAATAERPTTGQIWPRGLQAQSS